MNTIGLTKNLWVVYDAVAGHPVRFDRNMEVLDEDKVGFCFFYNKAEANILFARLMELSKATKTEVKLELRKIKCSYKGYRQAQKANMIF